MARELVPHSSHWGAFEAEVADGTIVAIHPYRGDPDLSPLLGNLVGSVRHRARITTYNVSLADLRQDIAAVIPPDGAALERTRQVIGTPRRGGLRAERDGPRAKGRVTRARTA